jgi:hypothetical protein
MDAVTSEVLVAALAADVPQLLWGAPGIGKTSSIVQHSTALGYHTRVLTGNVRLPEDFGGMPVVRGDRVIMSPPDWAVEANEHEKAVIIFDELTTSTPAVQSAMLRILTERYAGDYLLGPGVRFLACANPPEQAANGWELPAPLANRFLHLDFRADPDEWVDGMTIGWDRQRTLTVPHQEHTDWRPRIAGYIKARRGQLDPAPPRDAHLAGRAWPSPRTWDYAARVLSYCHTSAAQHLALAGLVGHGAAVECMAWIREADLPSPEALIADPTCFDWNDGKRADRAFAALASAVSYVAADLDNRWEAGWKLLGHVGGTTRVDVGINAADQMLRLDPDERLDIDFGSLLPYADLLRAARRGRG